MIIKTVIKNSNTNIYKLIIFNNKKKVKIFIIIKYNINISKY